MQNAIYWSVGYGKYISRLIKTSRIPIYNIQDSDLHIRVTIGAIELPLLGPDNNAIHCVLLSLLISSTSRMATSLLPAASLKAFSARVIRPTLAKRHMAWALLMQHVQPLAFKSLAAPLPTYPDPPGQCADGRNPARSFLKQLGRNQISKQAKQLALDGNPCLVGNVDHHHLESIMSCPPCVLWEGCSHHLIPKQAKHSSGTKPLPNN